MSALEHITVVDLSRLTPGPYATMMLADFGADVIRVDPVGGAEAAVELFGRGKRSIRLDLKQEFGQAVLHRLVQRADVVVEGFRPGVTSRLGADAATLMALNPRLIYCSVTGWGQDGPLAQKAGHDINFIAIAGVLGRVGRADAPPTPPLNLVADMGGGGLLAAFGILAALAERERSGRGQVIDAAMLDGALSLNYQTFAMEAAGLGAARGHGYLDSGAPFYDAYKTADGGWMAVGSVEPQFLERLCRQLDIETPTDRDDATQWPALKERMAVAFRSRTRTEWEEVFAGVDACVTPVLDLDEVADHPQVRARQAMVATSGRLEPAPAPRLARTPGRVRRPAPEPGQDTRAVLDELGLGTEQIDELLASGAAA